MCKGFLLGNLVLIGIIGLVIGFYTSFGFTQEGETLTITTYYPSPYGVYKELRAKKMAIGDSYYDASRYVWGDDIDSDADLVVEGKVGIGTMRPDRPFQVVGKVSRRHTAAFIDSVEHIGVALGEVDGIVDIQAFDADLPEPNRYQVNLILQGFGGNVGIGTTTPTQKLDVNGYVKGRDGLCIGDNCRSSWPKICIQCRCTDESGETRTDTAECAPIGQWSGWSGFQNKWGDHNIMGCECRVKLE